MKSVGMAALVASVANAALENCLYCRYTDLRATFLESWSYCRANEECLADQWNYIDRSCNDGWERASGISLDYCETDEAPCPEFVSSKQYDLNEPLGKYRNRTWTLPSGTKCVVKIDATQYVGRVLFDNIQGQLGVEGYDPDYDLTQKISFENTVGEVTIYNALETGSLRFTLAFSGAESIYTSVAAVLVSAFALTSF